MHRCLDHHADTCYESLPGTHLYHAHHIVVCICTCMCLVSVLVPVERTYYTLCLVSVNSVTADAVNGVTLSKYNHLLMCL
jgi:hypothetical protein